VQLFKTWFHVGYVGGNVLKFIPELPLVVFVCGGAVIAVGIKGRVDIDQVDALSREGLQLHQAIPAVDNAGLHGFIVSCGMPMPGFNAIIW
jgi:hypothetical protein